jgi:hypothetical protein
MLVTGRSRITAMTALAIVATVPTAATARAAPPTKLECAAAHGDAQRLRSDGDLRAAREKLLTCSREPCPKVVIDECVPWLAEVEHAMPSVVLQARTADGDDASDVSVSLDGRRIATRLDGRAIDVNPGEHILRFEPSSGAVVERRVLVAEGEKDRIVRVEVGAIASVLAPASSPPAMAHPGGGARSWTPVIVAGGIGGIALGGFTFFALTGVANEGRLDDCKPLCSASRIDAVRRDYIAADVFLGVAVVALGAAAYLALSRR